jgi:hypothetical protein
VNTEFFNIIDTFQTLMLLSVTFGDILRSHIFIILRTEIRYVSVM